MSCAFVVCDITACDEPVVYASESFETLTGYPTHEILGRNCRFLQSPGGLVEPDAKGKYVDDRVISHLKAKLTARAEVQVTLVNYRKGGQPFTNFLTMIPLRWDSSEFRYCIGLQIDLKKTPQAVRRRNAGLCHTISEPSFHGRKSLNN